MLAPGFIDSHTHDDQAVLDTPDLACKLSQGVTTVIAGNCGISLAPLQTPVTLPAPFPLLGERRVSLSIGAGLSRCAAARASAVNLALLTGHSSSAARQHARPTRSGGRCGRHRKHARQAETRPATGQHRLSTGLDYPPAQAAPTDESRATGSVLREFKDAVYVTHMRDEGDQVIAAVSETLDIGQRAQVPVIISHHKCAGPANYGRSRETLAMIDQRSTHSRLSALDVYPYIASSTSLLLEYIRDAESVLVAESTPHPECNGLMLERIAADWQCSLAEACERLYPATAIYFQMDEQDLQRIMAHPAAMIGSDGIASMQDPASAIMGHFPARARPLRAREKAVRTGNRGPQDDRADRQRFGLQQRGRIEIGHFADLVLFDAERIIDRASFAEPHSSARAS